MTERAPDSDRTAKILADLQDAVARMHVVSQQPRVVVATGARHDGARAMAWQVLFERSLGPEAPRLLYRGVSAGALMDLLLRGFDSEPSLGEVWAHRRMVEAMSQGPVIAAFRADRLPDDVAEALVGILVFEEDGLRLDGVRVLVGEVGVR